MSLAVLTWREAWKTESHAMTCLDVSRSGTFTEKPQVIECATDQNMNHRTTERSTSDSLGDVSWIQRANFTVVQKECATPPHVQVRQSVLAFPCVSTASNKHWGEKACV